MERMPRIMAVIALGLAVIAIPVDADGAPSRPRPAGTFEERMKICDFNNIYCGETCDQTIDIDNAVAECRKRCDARYARCQKWARTKALIVQPTDDDGGILVGPNMSLSSGAPDDGGNKGGGDDTGGDDTMPLPDGKLQ